MLSARPALRERSFRDPRGVKPRIPRRQAANPATLSVGRSPPIRDQRAMLASRTFTEADQSEFAAVSGDRNPMHLDALLARRTQAGVPVVHGLHLVLWGSMRWPAPSPVCRRCAA